MKNSFFKDLCTIYLSRRYFGGFTGHLFSHTTAHPQAMFWDENYHVPNAQKYVDGVMYMEPHPPLGKLLMAVGEFWFGGNENVNKTKLLETDYLTGDNAPPEMTYKGFRWPSVR